MYKRQTLCRALNTLCGVSPLVLSQKLRTGVTVDIENPAELGDDLLAGAIAARAAWPLPAVVLDLGTATKLTAVDASGAVRGVSILPGVLLSLNALVSGASQLGGLALCPPCLLYTSTPAGRLYILPAFSCIPRTGRPGRPPRR